MNIITMLWLWYTRCTIKDCNFVAQVHFFQLPCSTQGKYQAECQQLPGIRSRSKRMNWVLSWLFYSKCSRWIGELDVGEASVENQALTYIYFSGNHGASILWILWVKHETIFKGKDHWRCNDQFLLWIKRFYIISNFFVLYLTTPQIEHIWVHLAYIPPDMANTTTTETSVLEDIDIIICIRANFLGLYNISSFW